MKKLGLPFILLNINDIGAKTAKRMQNAHENPY
jgi:hypothetical protein